MGMWEAIVQIVETLSKGNGLLLLLVILLAVCIVFVWLIFKYGIPHLKLVAGTLEGIKCELTHMSENQKQTNEQLSKLYKDNIDFNLRLRLVEEKLSDKK